MRDRYFTVGTALGLTCAFLVAYKIMGQSFLDLMAFSAHNGKFNGIVPVVVGALASLALAHFIDQKKTFSGWFFRAMLYPVVIFLLGACTGSAINVMLNADGANPVFDYFVKPTLLLCYVGVPASIVVGCVYSFLFSLVRELRS